MTEIGRFREAISLPRLSAKNKNDIIFGRSEAVRFEEETNGVARFLKSSGFEKIS